MLRGDLFLFESEYSGEVFRRKIGKPGGLVRIVHNGVSRKEFQQVVAKSDASDLVFMGELRPVKGVDVLINAIAQLQRRGRVVTATLVGDGPERDTLRAQVERLGLVDVVQFRPAMPARQAQSLGRVMVIPSRAESLPYVVLEAAAAGLPLITTKVGGVPEIYGSLTEGLVAPEDVGELAKTIAHTLDHPDMTAEIARRLRERVATSFSVDNMVDGVLNAYEAAIERLRQNGRR
jgi:glycosyltransferase involved in cell wall biosynthesis